MNLRNQIAQVDVKLAKKIAKDRIVCNQELFEDGLIITRKQSISGLPTTTMLDIINSLFGIDGNGKGTISAQFDKYDNLVEFYDLERRK